MIDKASKLPFSFPLPSKQANGVARKLFQLCLTFGVPEDIRCDGGKDFGATIIQHLCQWLNADIQLGPADHLRTQRTVEKLGGWMQDVMSEFLSAWPEPWDQYASSA